MLEAILLSFQMRKAKMTYCYHFVDAAHYLDVIHLGHIKRATLQRERHFLPRYPVLGTGRFGQSFSGN